MPHERYATGWTDPRTIFGKMDISFKKYGNEYNYVGWLMTKKKADAHVYETEAINMPIEACQNLWLVTYGDEWIDASELVTQDSLTWEIGNRLYWAGLLEHEPTTDKYKCKS